MSDVKERLMKIAGDNVMGIDSIDIRNLTKALNYLHLQMNMSIKQIEDKDTRESMQYDFDSASHGIVNILSKD